MFKIITGFLGWVLHPIVSVLNLLPGLPPELIDILSQVLSYMRQGMAIFNFFCPLLLISPALAVWLTVYVVKHSYDLIMWILRKIPMISIQ